MTTGRPEEHDYYRILGVLSSAKLAEITAGYHALARKFHPDVGAADAESLAKFKLASEAYEVLSNEHRRREYDRRQRRSQPPAHKAAAAPLWRRTGSTSTMTRPGPNDVEVELPISPEEAAYGGPCEFIYTVRRPCSSCSGLGTPKHVCGSCQGRGMVESRRCLELIIPQRTLSGTVIRLPEQGRASGAARGDLLVRLRIQPCW